MIGYIAMYISIPVCGQIKETCGVIHSYLSYQLVDIKLSTGNRYLNNYIDALTRLG